MTRNALLHGAYAALAMAAAVPLWRQLRVSIRQLRAATRKGRG